MSDNAVLAAMRNLGIRKEDMTGRARFFRGGVTEGAGNCDTSVIDQDVQLIMICQHLADGVFKALLLTDVQVHGGNRFLLASVGDKFFKPCFVYVRSIYLGASGGKSLAYGAADARSRFAQRSARQHDAIAEGGARIDHDDLEIGGGYLGTVELTAPHKLL